MRTYRHGRSSTIGLALISGSALAFEISLTRLFAIQQFHHFAFMVISLAVMGTAASGFLIARRRARPHLGWLALAYSFSVMLAYLVINFLPFDSYSIAWDPRQVGVLLLYFLAAGAPFLFSGWTIGACLNEAAADAHRPYAASMIGSALGCPAALIAQTTLGEVGSLGLCIALGLLAAAIFWRSQRTSLLFLLLASLFLVTSLQLPPWLMLNLSPYKPLSWTTQLTDARTTLTVRGLSSRVDLVESRAIHSFPGLSLNASVELPLQAALFVDGEGPLPITSLAADDPRAAAIASYMPANLAFLLRPNAHTLILRPGAGLDALLALASGAAKVAISSPEPLISGILSGTYSAFSQRLLDDPRLELIPRGDRGALRAATGPYDIILFALGDPYRPVTSGAFSLTEDFTWTVEAVEDAYQHLSDDGLIVITRWLSTPPSECARAWSTLLTALRHQGLFDLTPQVLAYRGMRTATMIASRKPFTPDELTVTRQFLKQNAFDIIVLPGHRPVELNRFNRLPQDTYHELYSSLLDDPGPTIANYDFNLRPPTDDRPYFFHFFRWRQTPQVVATLGLTWQPFGGSGYLVLFILLGTVTIFALPLALAPRFLLRHRTFPSGGKGLSIGYFAFLGAAYLLVEIPLIQLFTLLLDRPALALATVLFSLLLASGIGSLASPRLPLRTTLMVLSVLLVLWAFLLPGLLRAASPWSLAARIALTVALLIPPGTLMGIPMAAGLRRLEQGSPGLIPWAWAINGSASGVTGVLAVLVALDFGLRATIVVGAVAYLGAWLLVRKPARME